MNHVDELYLGTLRDHCRMMRPRGYRLVIVEAPTPKITLLRKDGSEAFTMFGGRGGPFAHLYPEALKMLREIFEVDA